MFIVLQIFFYNRRNLKTEENDGNGMCIVSRWAVFNIVIFAKMSKVHYLQLNHLSPLRH